MRHSTTVQERPPADARPEPLLLTVEQTATLLSLSRTLIYNLLASGELESLKLAGIRRIPRQAVLDWIERQRAEQQAGH